MPRASLAYDKPSRVSRVLVLCFSLAVVLMAGWLVLMIMMSRSGTSMAAAPGDDARATAASTTGSVPRPFVVQSTASPISQAVVTTSRMQSASGAAWPDAPSATPPPAAPVASYAVSSIPATQEPSYRGFPTDIAATPAEASPEATEIVPLPQPRPKHMASVPVPRPRPQIDDPTDAPTPQRSLFDFLVDRQK
jgi:hypothetical protein